MRFYFTQVNSGYLDNSLTSTTSGDGSSGVVEGVPMRIVWIPVNEGPYYLIGTYYGPRDKMITISEVVSG